MNRTRKWGARRALGVIAAMLVAIGLAACGGGGGGGAVVPGGSAAALTLNGTAAQGAAIAGRPVDAKCVAGTGSATTAADGSYTLTITAGTLPCVLRVTLASGASLHTLAVGPGPTLVANLTPATQLIVASLVARDPA